MAVVAEELVSDLIVRDGKLRAGVRSAQQAYGRGIGQMRNDTRQFERVAGQSFANVGKAATRLFAALAAGASVKALLNIADAAKQIDAQLRLATNASGSFSQAQEDVRRIAADSRADLKSTADLYSTLQRNALELGITQEQAARSTETITKAFQISGATAAEAAGGLRQFLQGIQSGTLRGEELNSVLENAPRLARALADGLGVTIGQLRELGQAGQLTGAQVIDALESAGESIDQEFRDLPVTFDQAMTTLYNSAVITFGAFDQGGEFSKMLSEFIVDGSRGFEDMADAAREFGIDVRSTLEGLSDVFDPLVSAAREAFGLIGSDASSLADRIRPLLGEIDAIAGFFGGDTNLLGTFNRGQQRAETLRRNEIAAQNAADVFRSYDNFGNRIAGDPGRAARSGSGSGSGSTAAATRAAAAAARKAEADRLAAIRDEANRIAEAAGIQDDIIAARKAIATAEEDLLQFSRQQVNREIDQRIARIETDRKLGELSDQEVIDRTADLNTLRGLRLQEIEQRQADARAAQEERQAANAARAGIDTASAEAQIARTREERRDAELRILDLVYKEEEAAIRSAFARGEIADLDEALALLRRRQRADVQGVDRQFASPLSRYAESLEDPRDRVEMAVARKLEAVNQGITDALADALGTEDTFVKDLFSIFLDQVIFAPLAEALQSAGSSGGAGGLFGSVLGAIGGLFGGGRAGGGSVNAGRIYRVNEGQQEFFQPATDGRITPLSQAQPALAAGNRAGAPVIVQLAVAPGELFRPTVEAISGDVSVRTVQAATPGIVRAAGVEVTNRFQRPRT